MELAKVSNMIKTNYQQQKPKKELVTRRLVWLYFQLIILSIEKGIYSYGAYLIKILLKIIKCYSVIGSIQSILFAFVHLILSIT